MKRLQELIMLCLQEILSSTFIFRPYAVNVTTDMAVTISFVCTASLAHYIHLKYIIT